MSDGEAGEGEDLKTNPEVKSPALKDGLGEVDKTTRGFPYVKFHDRNGELCSLQNSSAIGGLMRTVTKRNMAK